MLVSVTSKKGGTGATTVALTLATLISKTNLKCCVVDLKSSQDYAKILNLDPSSNLDHLITELGINNEFIKVSDNIHKYGSMDVLLGTVVELNGYLFKKAMRLKELFEYLEDSYDIVLIDMKEDRLSTKLNNLGLTIYPIHVMDQNLLVTSLYQDEMKKELHGALVINKVNDSIYPDRKVFQSIYSNKDIFFLPYSNNVGGFLNETIRNGNLATKLLAKDQVFITEIKKLLNLVLKVNKEYNEKYLSFSEDSGSSFKEFLENADKLQKGTKKPKAANKTVKSKKGIFSFLSRKGAK